MDLSTTHLADLVRDAIREGDSLKDQWLNADKEVIIIDGDENPDIADTTFNMESVDRDLADLLSPHSVAKQVSSSTPTSSPTPANFPSSPASRLPRARQTSSFLPRLRSSNSPSIPRTPIHPSHTPPPPSKPSPSTVNGYNPLKPSSSPVLPSTSSSSRAAAAKVFGKQQPRSATPTRTLRQVMLGGRDIESPRPTTGAFGWNSLDTRSAPATENGTIGLGRPMSRGGASFTRPAFNRPSTSPERTTNTATPEADSCPSDTPFQEYRPSIDSNTTTRPSFDGIIISRPNSAAPPFRDRDRDGQQTPSLRVVDPTTARDSRASPIPRVPTNPPSTRMRKRSMSVQDSKYVGRNRGATTISANEDLIVRSGSSLSSYGNKTTTTSRGGSVGGGGTENGSNTNESSTSSSGPKMEWLGPRTAKAFRAAGLMDFDHHREKERDSREEGNSESTTERLLRDRSSSASGGVLSPSPLGVGNPVSTINRFASLRSASEYNPVYGRSYSRLTLSSETGSGAPRRGSESFYNYGGASSHGGGGGGGGGGGSYNGLMESPTFTVSSGSRDRDTPKSSISTGPTSLADSFGYLGRDRERDRELEMMREMKEKHGTEMGALLGALSDSQRTVRVLREENSDLRDRLERFTVAVQTNQELRRVCEDLQSECGSLRKENFDLRKELVGFRGSGLTHGGGANSSGARTPVPKTAVNNSSSSPLGRTFTSRVTHEEEYDNTFIDHGSEVENHITENGSSSPEINILASPSSKKRRLSNSSSIFPIPAPNMTLLLHEDVTSTLGSITSCRSSTGTEHSQYGFSLPPPIRAAASSSTSSQRIKTHVRSLSQSPPVSYHNFTGNILPNSSVISVGSISPSMVTGSPGSLFLRPEHEILLGDMESLDLGVRGDDGDTADDNVDGW